jgi:hypothetical protein
MALRLSGCLLVGVARWVLTEVSSPHENDANLSCRVYNQNYELFYAVCFDLLSLMAIPSSLPGRGPMID